MMKKAPASVFPAKPMHHVLWLVWKMMILMSIVLCLWAFFRLQKYSESSVSPYSTLPRKSRVFLDQFEGNPKIAFLYLARRDLRLDFLWGSFFENADKTKFSIYIHSEPGFVFDESTARSSFFYNRQLKNGIEVVWGEASMIEAERLLLDAALDDPANQRFVLLSDSFLDKKDARYNPKMSPVIPQGKWRKGSQWITLIRRHAEVIVDDEVVFPVFKKFCKRRPPVDVRYGKENLKFQKQHNCIPDEHYVQTLLAMNNLEAQLERRTVTYTLWNLSATKMENKGWHPITFSYADAGPQQIKRIKVGRLHLSC